jgi:curved DNA-binding protein
MEYKDYYKILGVAKGATTEEIKKAYRRLAKLHHPDKNPGDKSAEDKFKEIQEAHEVLKDPEKRKKYDMLGANWKQYQHMGGGSGFRNQAGGGGSHNFSGNFEDIFGGVGGFSDFFKTFMGGGFENGERMGSPQTGRDYEATIHISLEEAHSGVEKQFNLNGKKIKVKLKPGLMDGSRLRIKDQGGEGVAGGQRGNLYLTIKVDDHPIFERKENDLYLNLSVDLYTAILGGRLSVKTIDDKQLSVNIASETENGKLLRIPGMGLGTQSGGRGDLYLKVNIMIPKELSEKEKELFKQLQNLRN